MQLTPAQGRVLGSLIEKAATTPDSYPLSTNALVSACNQTTSRDPVVTYSEREVDAVMMELREARLARTVHGSGHRVGKHKHVVDETLGLDGPELAVLAVLMLRGPQTLNELVTRTTRYAGGPDGDPVAVEAALDRLADRAEPLVVRLARRPGEREPRIEQRWIATDEAPAAAGGPGPDPVPGARPDADVTPAAPPGASPPPAAVPRGTGDDLAALTARVDRLEAELAAQSQRIAELVEQLGG
jgi:uncharacterized protein YceH (UPF0502 family)